MAILFNPFSGQFDFGGGSAGAITSVGTIDSVSKSANGAATSGAALIMQTADATYPGLLSVSAQTIVGVKTFSSAVYAAAGLEVAATGGTDTLNIGTTNADIINIGRSGATVNIIGSTQYSQVTNLQVTDLLITLNKGGGAASASASGIELEENSVITGYAKTSVDRNSWALLAPNTAGIVTITPGAGGFTINQASHDPLTLGSVGSTPAAEGASLSGQVLTLQPADGTNGGVVSTTTQTFAGAKTFSSAPVFSTMTAGSVLFAGTSGTLTQDNASLFFDDSNNFLGIGRSSSLSAKLDIYRLSTTTSGTVSGIKMELDPTPASGTSTNNCLQLQLDDTGAGAMTAAYGINTTISCDNSTKSNVAGLLNTLTFNSGGSCGFTTSGVRSVLTYDTGTSSSSSAYLYGTMNSIAVTRNSSAVIEAYQYKGDLTQNNTSTITRAAGLYFKTTQTAGTITNLYGIFLDAPTISGTVTNRYGIYSGDASAINYFASNIRINGLTASTVPYTDANKDFASSAVTPTELGYVSGVTSAIQTQLGTKAVIVTGDIAHTSFTAADNQVAAANVTALTFANASVRSFKAIVSIVRASTYQQLELTGIQKGASWELGQSSLGDDCGLTFTITSAGAVQYTSTSTGSTATVNFRAWVTSV